MKTLAVILVLLAWFALTVYVAVAAYMLSEQDYSDCFNKTLSEVPKHCLKY